MKTAICIPARYNSSRLPGKLLMKLGKKTCIQHTFEQCQKVTLVDHVFVLTDDIKIQSHIQQIISNSDYPIKTTIILTTVDCINGTERISKHLHLIDEKYSVIVNVQADEPLVDPRNIDHAINMNMKLNDSSDANIFYTTLHQKLTDEKYIGSPSCVKVVINNENDVLLYSRAVIPSNKTHTIDVTKCDYLGFTGIYVFNRKLLGLFCSMENTPLQMAEDVEQLKILEHGYKIKSYGCPYFNEISLNDKDDYEYLTKKYFALLCTQN